MSEYLFIHEQTADWKDMNSYWLQAAHRSTYWDGDGAWVCFVWGC